MNRIRAVASSLRNRLALCVGVLVCVFTLAFSTWTLDAVGTDLRASVVEGQRVLLQAKVRELDEKVVERRQAIGELAILALRAGVAADAAAIETLLATQRSATRLFDAVAVLDADGGVVYESPLGGPSLRGAALADNEFFEQLREGAQGVVSRPFKPVRGSIGVVVFGAALRTDDGRFVGALAGVVSRNFLFELARTTIGSQGHFSLLERNETPRHVVNPREELAGDPAPGGKNHPIMAAALLGQSGAVESVGLRGVPSLRSYMPLNSVPWLLVAIYPVQEAYDGRERRRKEVMVVAAGLFAVTTLVAWWVTGLLLAPLSRLRAAMDQHASDPGLPIAVQSFGSSELAALVAAYNAQASSRQQFEDRLDASQRRLRSVLDNIPAQVAQCDREERYVFANKGAGQANHGVLGRTLAEVHGAAGYAAMRPAVEMALQGRPADAEITLADNGCVRHYQCAFVPVADGEGEGEVDGFYTLAFDITALKEAQARQAGVEERLRTITDNIPVLISYVDKDGIYRFLNATFRAWLGVDPATAVGRPMSEVLNRESYESRRPMLARAYGGERVTFEMADAATLLGRKNLQITYLPDRRPDGTVAGLYTLTSDVTELKDAQRRLAALARSDTLTELPNRFQFNEVLPEALKRSQRSGQALALMFLDVDRFKQINDSLGHAAGDVVLKEFARRLRHAVRPTDFVARLAGDEFVVILEGLGDDAEAQWVAARIIDELTPPFVVDGRGLAVTCSVGIAFHRDARLSPQDLLAEADDALYQSKRAGRNNFRLVAA